MTECNLKSLCYFYLYNECDGVNKRQACLADKPCWQCLNKKDKSVEDCLNIDKCEAYQAWNALLINQKVLPETCAFSGC